MKKNKIVKFFFFFLPIPKKSSENTSLSNNKNGRTIFWETYLSCTEKVWFQTGFTKKKILIENNIKNKIFTSLWNYWCLKILILVRKYNVWIRLIFNYFLFYNFFFVFNFFFLQYFQCQPPINLFLVKCWLKFFRFQLFQLGQKVSEKILD